VKNLFDVTGLPTRAGSKINRELPPSAHDSHFTRKLRDALELMDIELVDHMIVGTYKYYSMKEEKRL